MVYSATGHANKADSPSAPNNCFAILSNECEVTIDEAEPTK